MKLIIGLGNPGSKFKNTRHNIGREIVERLVDTIGADWKANERLQADIAIGRREENKLVLVRPHVFMNDSGLAAQAAAAYYKVSSRDILVIHDEADLPLGEIRVQQERGSAGHNGVQSIIQHLKTKDFMRMRIGIRPKNAAGNKMPAGLATPNPALREKAGGIVLRKFTNDEQELVQETIKKAIEEIMALCSEDNLHRPA